MPADPRDDLLRQLAVHALGSTTDPSRDLGEFVRRYAGSPDVAELDARYSFRDDVIIRELGRLLQQHPGDDIRVVDACCGMGVLAARLKDDQHVGPHTARIRYIALDQDPGCVDHVEGLAAVRTAFRSFDVIQRRVWDLADLPTGSADLIVLCNALHEIPPRRYPRMLAAFNALLHPTRGSVCVVDMESLPDREPEAVAINWTGAEVKRFLQAAGLAAEVNQHEKSVPVFQAHFRNAPAGVDHAEMLTSLRDIIGAKQAALVPRMVALRNKLATGEDRFKEWVIATGTIARYAEELLALDAELAARTPTPSASEPPAG